MTDTIVYEKRFERVPTTWPNYAQLVAKREPERSLYSLAIPVFREFCRGTSEILSWAEEDTHVLRGKQARVRIGPSNLYDHRVFQLVDEKQILFAYLSRYDHRRPSAMATLRAEINPKILKAAAERHNTEHTDLQHTLCHRIEEIFVHGILDFDSEHQGFYRTPLKLRIIEIGNNRSSPQIF